MAKKVIRLEFPDGSAWELDAQVIAEDRAKHYAEVDSKRGDGVYAEVYAKELEYTLEDDGELLDWFGNNYNWADVKGKLKMVKQPDSAPYSRWFRDQEHRVSTRGG